MYKLTSCVNSHHWHRIFLWHIIFWSLILFSASILVWSFFLFRDSLIEAPNVQNAPLLKERYQPIFPDVENTRAMQKI